MTERLLMAQTIDRAGEESEPVLVDVDGDSVVVKLEDGRELRLDQRELDAAIHPEAA